MQQIKIIGFIITISSFVLTLLGTIIALKASRKKLGVFFWVVIIILLAIIPLLFVVGFLIFKISLLWAFSISTFIIVIILLIFVEKIIKKNKDLIKENKDVIREQVDLEQSIQSRIKVDLYKYEPGKPWGLDHEKAVQQIEKANANIYVTHFIRQKPAKNLLNAIESLEKNIGKNIKFHRLVHFHPCDNKEDRENRYVWLRQRIKDERNENKYISEMPLPLDLLIIDTDIVLIELQNMDARCYSDLLVIKDKKTASSFRETFFGVFNKSYKLSLKILNNYILTEELPLLFKKPQKKEGLNKAITLQAKYELDKVKYELVKFKTKQMSAEEVVKNIEIITNRL